MSSDPQETKRKKILTWILDTLVGVILAPFALLFAVGIPALAVASLYFFITLGDFQYLIGAIFFGGISALVIGDK